MTQNSLTTPSAKIIADSICEKGHRLTTMEITMHRFVLAETNTHRVLSRNSASSRAIPATKMFDRVHADTAYPVHWGKEQQGMQSGEAFGEIEEMALVAEWTNAAQSALRHAINLKEKGLHKSLINRLLEPFLWHTAIVTASEWDNFFHQRCDPNAQPEMKAVADQMQLAYFTAPPPKVLSHGEWHLPYIKDRDWAEVLGYDNGTHIGENGNLIGGPVSRMEILKKVSTSRCARVSYLTHDGVRDIVKDVDMFDRKLHLFGHWSPLEHVATPSSDKDTWGNFKGWKQYRKFFAFEAGPKRFLPNLPELAQLRMKMEAGL